MIIDLDVSDRSALFSTIINECSLGIIVTDNSGLIKNVNSKLCKISGYNQMELLDADIDILTHHQQHENSLRYLIDNCSGSFKWTGNILIRLKNSESCMQQVRMVSHLNIPESEQYLIFYFDDQKNTDENVDAENDSGCMVSLGKMAAFLSHEIKTPLTSIKMNIDMMSRDPNLSATRIRSMQIIKNEISRLERLSKDVLYFSRSTRNTNCNFKLSELIDEITSLLFLQLREHDISLINKLEPDVLVCGDEHSIKTMFLHLIENSIESIKQNGKIEIWNDTVNKNSLIPIYISDNGEGIKDTENIFELFFTSKSAGTGLGLSIAKKIVEDHTGSIELTSHQKGNTIFKITLPVGSA